MSTRCSESGGPLPGSAKQGQCYVLVEHPGPWSRDILDGGTFDAELTSRLKELPGLYLIRKPGREGKLSRPERTVYLVFCEQMVVETLQITDLEELFELDLSAPGRNGARRETLPVLLVCTHAKRDVCCAVKGRPIAQLLVDAFPDHPIWECSHTKGHRFAPSMVLFPAGYAFGRTSEDAAVEVYEKAKRGVLELKHNRGRGIYSPPEQVAELAVLSHLSQHGIEPKIGSLQVRGGVRPIVTDPHGTSWAVQVEEQRVGEVVDSCGKPPKPGKAWVAVDVEKLNGA